MKKRVTVDLDDSVLGAVDALAGEVRESRSSFIVASVEERLRKLARERVDAAFARMADDSDYRTELSGVEREMAVATDAAWGIPQPSKATPAARGRGRKVRRGAR